MTAKKTRKTAKPNVTSRSKPPAAVKTEPAAPKAGGPPEPCAAVGNVESLITGSMISMAVKRVFGIVVYALAVCMALQLAWGGVKFAGKAISLYRQFSQFRQWEWRENLPPAPLPDGDFSNIKKYIRKNFARSIPAKERDAAAQVFGEAADRAADGTLINRDDALGFLGENLKPVCRAPAWVPLLTGLWTELNLPADAPPAEIEKACRAVADALSEVALVLAGAAAPAEPAAEQEPEDKAEPEPAADPEPDAPTDGCPSADPPAPVSDPEPARDCPGGKCPSGGNGTYYQNYGWRWYGW